MSNNGQFVVVCIDKRDDEVSVWETGFKTYEEAKQEVMEALKENWDSPIFEECEDADLEDGEFISEEDLAYYDYGEKVCYFLITYVSMN